MVHCGHLKIQPILFVHHSNKGISVLFHLVANVLQWCEALNGFRFTDDFISGDKDVAGNVMQKDHEGHLHVTKTKRDSPGANHVSQMITHGQKRISLHVN